MNAAAGQMASGAAMKRGKGGDAIDPYEVSSLFSPHYVMGMSYFVRVNLIKNTHHDLTSFWSFLLREFRSVMLEFCIILNFGNGAFASSKIVVTRECC